jgi:hypothetical protein
MKAGSVIDIAAAIVTVALVTVIVTGKNTAPVISAIGSAFSGSLKAAMGR